MDRHQLAQYIKANLTDDEVLEFFMAKPTNPVQSRSKPTATPSDLPRRVTKPTNTDQLVLAAIGPGKGYAVSDIEPLVPDVPRTGVQRALAKLKGLGTIHAAGDRRFMRYALTLEDAETAAKEARGA